MDDLVALGPRADERGAEHHMGGIEGECLIPPGERLGFGHHLGLAS